MKSDPSVIVLEFNELSPSLMARFIAERKLPNFQHLHDEAEVYVTDAGEQPPNLEPWIQWVTVHSGLTFSEHRIYHLDEGHKLTQKCIWDVLSDAKFQVAVCGSMNVHYDMPLNGCVLPDPWSTASVPYPETLLPYFRFIQRHVQEYTNDRIPISQMECIRFVAFMLTHGLSVSTVSAIFRQLLSELGGKNRWKRTMLLDKLQFDLFRWFYRRQKPHFSTFFSNSTAHLQHMYWRNMEPELFNVKPTSQEQAEFDQAILTGYQAMDKLVGEALTLAGENTTLLFCTALSQQPCLKYEEIGGKSFYRPRDFGNLTIFVGITAPHTVSPVMSEQFHLYFENEPDAIDAERRLTALRLADRSVLYVERNGKTLFSGCCIFNDLPESSVLTMAGSNASGSFFKIFYKIDGTKSGMHHPDGMLWIRKPDKKHVIHREKVPLTVIAPAIMDMFGLVKRTAS